MGYLTVGNIFHDIFGKDNLTKLKAGGETIKDVYVRYNQALETYAAEAARIPSGSGEKRLRETAAKLRTMSAQIAPAFAPGNVPGAATEKLVNDFVTAVKKFGADKSALVREYGQQATKGALPPSAAPRPVAKAGFGGIPLWGWGLALLALAKFAKKK